MSSTLSVKLKIWEMFPKTRVNFFINHRRAFGVYKTKELKEGKAMRKGLGVLLALVLALLPGMARSEAVLVREVDHIASMDAAECGLLLSGSYADGEADRPSVRFLDFAGRRLYSWGNHAHDGGCRGAALLEDGSFAVLRYGDRGFCLERVRGREVVWSREIDERGAFTLFCDGERILVDAAPAVGVSTLTALDMDGATLWETRWEESLRFAGILACAEGYLAYGCRVEAEENYPFAVCVDAQGAEVWRCEGQERGEVVAACVDGGDALLLIDVRGGDGWPTRLMRLRAGAVVWQQDYPSARAEDAVTQRALDILPYEGGALIALRFGHPLAGECLLRQVDAQGGVVAEWRVAFPELYGVQKAALVPCGEEVYLAAYGEPAEAAALETADWFDGSDPTLGDFADLLVVREVELPEG